MSAGTHTLTALAPLPINTPRQIWSLMGPVIYMVRLLGHTSNPPSSYGTVFELPSGANAVTTVASFNGVNGMAPMYNLVRDGSGNLYGVAEGNQGAADPYPGTAGYNALGIVFEVASGTSTIQTLASFIGNINGYVPAGLVSDAAGNLYGTTGFGKSIIFTINANTHAMQTLAMPPALHNLGTGPLTIDATGNLYGTAQYGNDCIVYELPIGATNITTLATFTSLSSSLCCVTPLATFLARQRRVEHTAMVLSLKSQPIVGRLQPCIHSMGRTD